MKKFKIRCSQISKIMTKPRSKSEVLSQTTKTYLEQLCKEIVFNRKYEFSSKYTEKGNICEDQSIDFIADQLGYGLLVKNEQFYSNDFICGTPDVITNDEIIDVKNSWDCFTFPLFSDDIPNKDYYYQLQGYMALTGKDKAKLIYVLSDTPQHLIEKEWYYHCKNNGHDVEDGEMYKEFESKMMYSDIAPEYKIKTYIIPRDEEVIKEIYERVNLCKDFVINLIK